MCRIRKIWEVRTEGGGKRVFLAVCAALLCIGLSACGFETEKAVETESAIEETTETQAEEKPLRVCVIGDADELDAEDLKAYRECAEQAAGEYKADMTFVEGSSKPEWKKEFKSLCEGGYDLVVVSGSNLAEYVADYAEKYPELRFSVAGASVELENVQSVDVLTEDGYGVLGVAAAVIAGETSGIGWVGGIDIPAVRGRLERYEQGAAWVNAEIEVQQAFSGEWEVSEQGEMLIASQFAGGAEAVLYVPFEIASELDEMAGNGLYAAVEETDTENEAEKICIASVEKRMEKIVGEAVRVGLSDSYAGGTTTYLSLRDGAVEVSFADDLDELVGKGVAEDIFAHCERYLESLDKEV